MDLLHVHFIQAQIRKTSGSVKWLPEKEHCKKSLFSLSKGEFQETLLFPSIDCLSFTGRLAIDSQ